MAYAIRKFDYSLFSGSFRAGLSPSVHTNKTPGSGPYESSGSLQGWWRLNKDIAATVDGDMLDSSGNGRDGTFAIDPTDRPAFSTALYPSQSLYVQGAASCTFDGTNTMAEIGAGWDAIIGTAGTNQVTIAAWIYKTGDGGSSHGRMVDWTTTAFYTSNTAGGFAELVFRVSWDSVNYTWVQDTGTIPLNTWVHVAVTYDGSSSDNQAKGYVDGAEVEMIVDIPLGTRDTVSLMSIGGRSASRAFEGQLSDVAVWNTILTAEEIKAIYEVSSTGAFLPTRNYDLIGSSVTPPYTGSYGSTLQGINITTFERFGMSVAPKMGRSDRPAVFLSSSDGFINVTPENNDFFDDALRLPQPITFESSSIASTVTSSNQQLIGEDSFRVVQVPQYILNHQAYGLENLFVERDPFVEMDQFSPTIYIGEPLRMAWPVVMENPSPIDPFDFNGAIEPFALRRPLAGFSTFIGSAEDPEPTGMRGSVSSGMMQDVFYKRSVASSNFYFPGQTSLEPFEMIGASEEYDEPAPLSAVATGSLLMNDFPAVGDEIILTSSDGTAATYVADTYDDPENNIFDVDSGTMAGVYVTLVYCLNAPEGHAGKIKASFDGGATPSTGRITLYQAEPGYNGNTVITSSLTNVTASNFAGGTGIWKPLHAYVKQLPYMTDITASLAPFEDATSPEDAFYYVSNREIRDLLEVTFTKADRLGVPSRNAKSADCGWSYENSVFGIDSVAFGGLKK